MNVAGGITCATGVCNAPDQLAGCTQLSNREKLVIVGGKCDGDLWDGVFWFETLAFSGPQIGDERCQ